MKSISRRISSPQMNSLCGQTPVSLLQWEKKRFIPTSFRVDSFAQITFDLNLETDDKCILVLKRISLRVWFFDQSEFGKKSNSITRLFRHWKRLTSKHSLQRSDFIMRQFVVSMEKRSTILNFCSIWIILMEFSFVFVPLSFVFKVEDKWIAVSMPKWNRFRGEFHLPMCGQTALSLLQWEKKTKRLILYDFPGWLFYPD